MNKSCCTQPLASAFTLYSAFERWFKEKERQKTDVKSVAQLAQCFQGNSFMHAWIPFTIVTHSLLFLWFSFRHQFPSLIYNEGCFTPVRICYDCISFFGFNVPNCKICSCRFINVFAYISSPIPFPYVYYYYLSIFVYSFFWSCFFNHSLLII